MAPSNSGSGDSNTKGQAAPLSLAERRRLFQPRPALKTEVDFTVHYRQMIVAAGEPGVEFTPHRMDG